VGACAGHRVHRFGVSGAGRNRLGRRLAQRCQVLSFDTNLYDGKRPDLPLHKRVPPEHRVPLRACDVEGLRRLVRAETVGGQGGERATHSTLGVFLGLGSTTPIDALPEGLLICSTQ